MSTLNVAVIDVGSNTARLLVADTAGGRVTPVHEEKAYLGLAREIVSHGRVSETGIAQAGATAAEFARAARRAGAEVIETVVTAPGRQSDGTRLVRALERATNGHVRVLAAEEEARLAFAGALAGLADPPAAVAVCDVGGGSTELAVGDPRHGPSWIASVDAGSLWLTESFLRDDPPSQAQLEEARLEAWRLVGALAPPPAELALATGGSARAAAKLVGRRFDADDLEAVARVASRRPAARLAKGFGLDPPRARTLAAGALLLAAASRALGRPFELAGGGLREGAALALAVRSAAA